MRKTTFTFTRDDVNIKFPREVPDLADFLLKFDEAINANPYFISRTMSMSEDQRQLTIVELWENDEAPKQFWENLELLQPVYDYMAKCDFRRKIDIEHI